MSDVIVLASNRPANRFYRGGLQVTRFRGEADAPDHEPEDWVASTTAVAGEPEQGVTVLPDGRRLDDAVAADPQWWFGAVHTERFGADAKLLVKLLDAGQRLPVHAHPHRDFAKAALGRAHGKAEAWYILRGGTVHLGLTRAVDAAELADLVARQDTEALLGLLHRREVAPGDVVYVPPGVLHAIGEGVLLLELQEPEDLSILLEWRGFALDGERDGHLGLGFDVALGAVDHSALDEHRLDSLVASPAPGDDALPAEAASYFRLERIQLDGAITLEPGFAVVVITAGSVQVTDGPALPKGSTALIPFAAGAVEFSGRGEVLIARPPRAEE